MSSHGGQRNFPFGCMPFPSLVFVSSIFPLSADVFTYPAHSDQPENLHGIGLPEFITPGPPPGQPLLNAHENQDLDNFLQDFDQNAAANKSLAHAQFSMPPEHGQVYNMPPMFVGSDTAMGHRSVIDPHQLMGGGFPYDHNSLGHNMNTMSQANVLGGMHGVNYADPAFHNPLIAQLQSAASMQPAYTQGWQQSFPGQNMMNMPTQGRMGMGFGTDSRFQPSGYSAPHNPMDPDIPQGLQMENPIGEWFEPTSASTTQSNTQPNTQPSSPNWSKKRNFDDFTREQQPRNGYVVQAPNPAPSRPSAQHSKSYRKRSVVKMEATATISQSSTPLSNSKSQTPLETKIPQIPQSPDEDEDEDAEAEDEDEDPTEPPRSPPAPWPGSKPRPPKNTKVPPPKPPRRKKSSISTSTPKPKKPQLSQKNSSTRTPLSIDQKKANHTNSEQRRRDATARSYAELYDLVPELDDIGKQSTMKKLEVVVAKVRSTKGRVEELRAKLSMDPVTGRPLGGGAGGGSGMLMYSDAPGWHQ